MKRSIEIGEVLVVAYHAETVAWEYGIVGRRDVDTP